jgi:2-oxo-3-hexenedioate decarboxylase
MAEDTDTWATALSEAAAARREAPRPSASIVGFDLDRAYAIQAACTARREAAGERVRAIKLGLTRQAEQDQWGLSHPTFGTLTDRMLIRPGETFSLSRGHAPRIEAEIVVVMAEAVTRRPGSLAELLPAIGQVHGGIEILDSRFRDGVFHPLDAVADNQSALSGVWSVQGRHVTDGDWGDESVTVTINSRHVATGHGSAILGNPLNAIFGVVDDRLARGFPVPAGLAIFSGNLLDQAQAIAAGDHISVSYSSLGELHLDIVDETADVAR